MHSLQVRVNDELTLDAGRVEEVQESGRVWRIVHPPRPTLFEQVLAYLERRPDPGWQGLRIGREAIAAVAVCLRWGSYLAVLLDGDKPLWPRAQQDDDEGPVGRISDAEMARINVEMSAALAQWIDIMRADYEHYLRLTRIAVQHLPMTRKSVTRSKQYWQISALVDPDVTRKVVSQLMESEWGQDRLAEAQAHPTRVFANALTNACWRNGPVESIHAGRLAVLPLTQRRITKREEHLLIRVTAERLVHGLLAAFKLT